MHLYKTLRTSILLVFTVLLTGGHLFGQGNQSVTGTVLDQVTETPLIGATVEWLSENGRGTTTDETGYFKLTDIPPGRHQIKVSYLGYATQVIPNIVVTSGKAVILEIYLQESVVEMQEVVISAEQDKASTVNEMAAISARTFSVEEVNRFSGGRSDVGRLVANFAGVSAPNDARNDIVIRGNAPTGVLWRLEGIPIPNPNHFSTLGTTGGPVSALNTNLLKNSDFLTSAFPAEYGNALAGVFDLGFRSGNRDDHEFMFQLGAVSGLEFMAEGPLDNKEATYMVSGRYSFVGLMAEAGLNIGTNASPHYEDLAFKVDLSNGRLGKFTLFGVGGLSDIEFLHDELDEADLFAAEDEDSYAKSRFGVAGVRHNILLDKKTYLRSVVAVSTSGNEFLQERLYNLDTDEEFSLPYQEADNSETRLSLSSFVNRKFNARLSGRMGILVEQSQYKLGLSTRLRRPDNDGDGYPDFDEAYTLDEGTTLLQVYTQWQYRLGTQWTLNGGVHFQYLAFNETSAIEPRLALNYAVSQTQTLSLGYGMHHQTQPLPILLLQDPATGETYNHDLGFTRSHHLVLAYDWRWSPEWRMKAEMYYQWLDNVPVETESSSFSVLNVGADFGFPTDVYRLENTGTGFNRGFELTVEKFFSHGFYGLFSGSVYESRYEGSDGVERNTAFNNTYVANVLAGREMKIGSNGRNTLTLDTKLTMAGGRRYTPVDLEASAEAGYEITDDAHAYEEQFDPYLRWDVKIGWRRDSRRKQVSHHLFFDFQNVTNRQNIFIKRYNRVTNTVQDVYQVGFFPDFMYRIQF